MFNPFCLKKAILIFIFGWFYTPGFTQSLKITWLTCIQEVVETINASFPTARSWKTTSLEKKVEGMIKNGVLSYGLKSLLM